MFDVNETINYELDWSDMPNSEGQSSALTNLFDNFFGWVNDSLESRYVTLDQQRREMLLANPDLDIKSLEDGFALEAERLNAIQQRSSRGFTIIDINPGLLTNQNYPVNLPYEFLFDGSNFIPDQDDSLTKNFRSVPIEIAGNFVKIEYIYENNTDANRTPTNSRPKAQIKYQQALKNTATVNGQTIYSETNLTTGYLNYFFDNFSRSKVFIGFGDTSQKPHLVKRSGDFFKTYFNSLNITLNIGAPKIRITVGFNSEKFDGPSDAPMNSQLHMLGLGRLFNDSDSVMAPFNLQWGDQISSYSTAVAGLPILSGGVVASTSYGLVYNKGYNLSGGLIGLGYSVLWISSLQFTSNRTTAANSFIQFNLTIGPTASPSAANTIRVYGAKLDMANGSTQQQIEHVINFTTPLRVVIPVDSYLALTMYHQSSVNTNLIATWSISGYSYGQLQKIESGAFASIFSTKYITDSTLLSDYNRIEVIKDNL